MNALMSAQPTASMTALLATLALLPFACGRGPMFCALECGDGECRGDETCESCPSDCGFCPGGCGDEDCGEVLQCIYACQDILCPNTCLESGCYEAQQEAHTVIICLISNCIMNCINPSSPECQTCLINSCGGELLACATGDCSQ